MPDLSHGFERVGMQRTPSKQISKIDTAQGSPLKNGVGILEAFFHFFLGLVPCRNNGFPSMYVFHTQNIQFSGGAIVPKTALRMQKGVP